MPNHQEGAQYEIRKRIATIPVPGSRTNFIVISRMAPMEEGQHEKIDVRRFYMSKVNEDIRPTKNGAHIHLDMIEDVLAGIWMALTPNERKRCMDSILKVESN